VRSCRSAQKLRSFPSPHASDTKNPHCRDWHGACSRPRRRAEAVCLWASQSRGSDALLHRHHSKRPATAGVAQRWTMSTHIKAQAVGTRRRYRVRRRTPRGGLREIPEIRIRPRVRETAFRAVGVLDRFDRWPVRRVSNVATRSGRSGCARWRGRTAPPRSAARSRRACCERRTPARPQCCSTTGCAAAYRSPAP
jgi:hypothetical protein